MMYVQSEDLRRGQRGILNAVEHDGEHVTVQRYDTPAAVIVPVGWHEKAVAALGEQERPPRSGQWAQDVADGAPSVSAADFIRVERAD